MIKDLYNIKNQLSSFSESERETYISYLDHKYDFSDSTLQKELGIESLKKIFFQFIKKEINFNKMDTMTLKKIAKLSRKEQLPKVLSKKYNQIKHLVNKNDNRIELIMLRLLFLLNKEIVNVKVIHSHIDYIKLITDMGTQEDDINDILKLFQKQTYKRTGRKYKKIKNNTQLQTKIKNKIFNKIVEKKQKIFVEEKINDEDDYDKKLQYYLEKINKNMKNKMIYSVKIYFKYKVLDQFKEYFNFIFKLQHISKGKIDNIIRDSLYCLFDEYQTHIDFMLEKGSRFDLPFSYEENNTTYEISSTIIDYLSQLKDYKYIHKIIDHFLIYLDEKEYVGKFMDCDTIFYFSNLLGLLRLINYKGKSPLLQKMMKLFRNNKLEKQKKVIEGKIKYFKKYEDKIDLKSVNYKDIAKNKEGISLIKLEIVNDKKKLKDYILKIFPKSGKTNYKILKSMGIKTFHQYKNSEYYRKEQIIEKKEIKKIIKNNHINIYDIKPLTFQNIPKSTKYNDVMDKMKNQIDILNFKSLFGLTIENSDDLQIKYNKLVMNMTENNRNMSLANKLESNIVIMENKIKHTSNDNQKSKMIMELRKMEENRDTYKAQVKDLNIHGYAYGTNYEENYTGNFQYITTDLINKGKKMKEVMDAIDLVFKRKNENFKLNTFVIDMLLNFEYSSTELYKVYDMFINHNIEIIFEKYCNQKYKNIRQDLKQIGSSKITKSLSLDFSRLCMILFFIISNDKNIKDIYKQFTIKNQMFYLNKFVKYNNKIGKVLEINDDKLYVQFDLDIEILNKDQVLLVTTMEDKDIIIKKGNYKGRMARVYKQIGEKLSVTIDTYGKSNSSISTKVRTITIPLSYVELVQIKERRVIGNKEYVLPKPSDEIKYTKEVNPKNIKNKDLFSIARFLFSQVINKNRNIEMETFNLYKFIDLYELSLKHVNEMIKRSIIKNKDLEMKKKSKDVSYFKLKQIYSREGLMDFNLEKSKFRLTNDDIKLLKNNSADYKNEKDIENHNRKYKKSKKEIEEEKKNEEIKLENNIKDIINNFEGMLNNI